MEYESLAHTKYMCKYHIVFIPKYRRKKLFCESRAYLANRLKELAAHHVHMLISIPPKYSVAAIVGYIKGKSAIAVARDLNGRKRNFSGEHFWARGYFVSTVGLDEDTIRSYVERQMIEDLRLDKLEK